MEIIFFHIHNAFIVHCTLLTACCTACAYGDKYNNSNVITCKNWTYFWYYVIFNATVSVNKYIYIIEPLSFFLFLHIVRLSQCTCNVYLETHTRTMYPWQNSKINGFFYFSLSEIRTFATYFSVHLFTCCSSWPFFPRHFRVFSMFVVFTAGHMLFLYFSLSFLALANLCCCFLLRLTTVHHHSMLECLWVLFHCSSYLLYTHFYIYYDILVIIFKIRLLF